MKLLLAIGSLAAGGAERVMATLANLWTEAGNQVVLATLEDVDTPPFYELRPEVQLRQLGLLGPSQSTLHGLARNQARVRALRKLLRTERPDVMVTFTWYVNVLAAIASVGTRVPLVVAEHTDPELYALQGPWRMMQAIAYRLADRIVVLNERTKHIFSRRYPGRVVMIPNPVAVDLTADHDIDLPCRRPFAAAMGRFSGEKRFDLLLEAFALIAPRFPGWTLVLIGDGPLRAQLTEQSRALGLTERTVFTGRLSRPHGLLAQANVFISASVLEAFPMAICEAMACGVPVVAAEYHDGIHDLIQDGQNGMIVPPRDPKALGEAMAVLFGDEALRRRLADRAREMAGRFAPARVAERWRETFAEIGVRA